MMSSMIKIEAISSVVIVWIAATSATVSMPLRDCESKTTGDFDTDCDGNLYIPSLPLCGRGQRLNNTCVTTSQVSEACKSCEPGFFQEYNNKCRTCHQCSVCGAQQRTVQPCNAEQDTVCEDLDPTQDNSPETDIPSSSTDTDSPNTAAPSSSTKTDENASGTAFGTTPRRTSTSKPTTAAPEDPTILTTGVDVNQVDTSAQDGTCEAVIPLVICVVLLSFLLAVAVICCVCYRNKYMANLRRNHNDDVEEDIEGQNPRCRDVIPLDPFHLENGGIPPSPPVSPVRPTERPDGGHSQCPYPNGLDNGHPSPPTPDEPLYATVNKTGNSSKAVAADHERPTSSSGHCHKNVVCKVLKGRRKGAGKKETELGSVVEKDSLLSPEPVALDDHQELGGSKRSQPMHGTGPTPTPSVLPTASPSPPPTPPPPTLELPPSPLPSPSQPSSSPLPSSPPPSSPPPLPSASASASASSSPPLSPPSSSPSTSSPPPPLPSSSPPQSSPPLSPPSSSSSSSSTSPPPLPTPSPPPSSPPPLPSPPPPTDGIPAQENGVGEGDVEKDNGGAATKEGHDTNAHSPGEDTSCTSSSVGAKLTNDLVRGAEGGASSLPPVTPGVNNLPEPGEEVGEEMEEELRNTSINPDEVVSEKFLDDVTDVINLRLLERIARNFSLTQVAIDNLKDSLSNTSPKNIGYHILQAVLKYQGRKLTFRRLLTAIRDCDNKNAADKLIAKFRIDLNFEKR